MWFALANKTIRVEGTVKQVPLRPLGFEWARHVLGAARRPVWLKQGRGGGSERSRGPHQIGGFAGRCEGLWLLLSETGATSGIWTKYPLIEGECRHSLGMAEEKPSNWIFTDDFLGFQVILPCGQVESHCFREARGPINRRETGNPYLKLHSYCFPNGMYKWQLTTAVQSSRLPAYRAFGGT